MCGACGNHSVKDWSWPWLAGTRSATLIGRAAERLSGIRGIRILPAPYGWQVRMPTGSTQLVQSVTELARVAQVDSTAAPEVSPINFDETSIIDRRRSITVTVAQLDEPTSAASTAWPDALMGAGTTVVTIDGSSPTRLLHALEHLAQTASLAPYRDHVRMLPLAPDMMHKLVVHHWVDLPKTIECGDLPALCLSLAARLVALPQTDSLFREARVRCGDNGTVQIQSVGAVVTAMEVNHAD